MAIFNNKNSEKSPENISEEKLRKDLDAIRSEIEKKTDILSNKKNIQPKEKFTKVKNQNYNTKKKSVAQIAEEIAEASVKNRETKIFKNKKQMNTKTKTSSIKNLPNVKLKQNSFAIPLIIFIFVLLISSSVYFRNNVLSLSHSYFPNFAEKNFHKVFDLFKHVKIPFYADFKNLEIENFGAVYEGKSVKFFGNIKIILNTLY